MNYSTAVFLINDQLRAVKCTYESHNGAPIEIFKTLDPGVAVGDLVVVPTQTRHNMTVVKVHEVDVDIDFDSTVQVDWIVARVDTKAYDKILKQEAAAIDEIKSAEKQRKAEELREKLLAHHTEKIKALPISTMNGNGDTED